MIEEQWQTQQPGIVDWHEYRAVNFHHTSKNLPSISFAWGTKLDWLRGLIPSISQTKNDSICTTDCSFRSSNLFSNSSMVYPISAPDWQQRYKLLQLISRVLFCKPWWRLATLFVGYTQNLDIVRQGPLKIRAILSIKAIVMPTHFCFHFHFHFHFQLHTPLRLRVCSKPTWYWWRIIASWTTLFTSQH